MAIALPLGGQPVEDAPSPRDQQVVEEIYEQYRLDREASTPGLGDWLREVVDRWMEYLKSRVNLEAATPSRGLLTGFALLVIAAGVCVLLWGLVAWLSRRRRSPEVPEITAAMAATDHESDSPDWRAELARRLDQGDASGALEALWWWLVGRLPQSRSEQQIPSSWTGRELIRRSDRPDLADSVSLLDRLRYGPLAPRTVEVRALFEELEGRLR